jgi:2-keto-4-pentenoate hydratase/2-oxohepta-3-ene-1,7-dioic acid hydratase in catechol pathway
MKLATFSQGGSTRIGVVRGEEIIDLSAAAPELPRDLIGFLSVGPRARQRAGEAAAASGGHIPLVDVKLESPILRPPKFLAVGLNYADHVAESGMEPPKFPTIFNKQSTCVTGPYDPVHLPRVSSALDYEGELAFVIGRRCRHVPRARAHEVIAGFCVHDDVSVRDWQLRVPTWTMGKSFDTHGPLGPWLTTLDEVGDPHALSIRTLVNGEVRQSSNTKELIFDCYALIEHITTAFTLEVGDVIATGTPSGVGIGMKPPRMLVAGDVVRIEIANLGFIQNEIVPEPEETTRF